MPDFRGEFGAQKEPDSILMYAMQGEDLTANESEPSEYGINKTVEQWFHLTRFQTFGCISRAYLAPPLASSKDGFDQFQNDAIECT